VQHTRRVPPIRYQSSEPIHDAKPSLRLSEQQNTGIRRDRATVERTGNFLGPNGWKREGNLGSICHGSVGYLCPVDWIV
jgi:hypothetical protein